MKVDDLNMCAFSQVLSGPLFLEVAVTRWAARVQFKDSDVSILPKSERPIALQLPPVFPSFRTNGTCLVKVEA